MKYQQTYQTWLSHKGLDETLKKELLTLSEADIKERFSIPLEFGTGGLRGKMGVGISRVNMYTIMQAAYGFGLYLTRHFKEGRVAISYDNRKDSYAFALKSAQVLSALGLEPYVFESLRPTPMLSFAVRHFNCIGGIMITASHNPKEDNGFKAYNKTGAQINLEEASEIIDYILGVEDLFSIPLGNLNQITYIHASFDDIYLEAIRPVMINPRKHPIKLTYSPLHGTGGQIIPQTLSKLGYHVFEVKEEMTVDPNFTYTKSSNPELTSSYDNSLKLAETVKADIALVTDPDADRLGVAVRHHETYQLLNGNQTAAIELFYILTEKTKQHTLPKDGIVYTTIVTSQLIEMIAKSFKLKVIKTLTGFKFIGEQAELNKEPYIFGCEESYGSLVVDEVRDKDAVQACILLSEIASNIYPKTLVDYLETIYQTYGYYQEAQDNFFFEGLSGKDTMVEILSNLRKTPLQIKGFTLESITDYLASEHYEHGKITPVTLPKSNVLVYRYSGQYVIFRPSGTEPKLKLYFSTHAKDATLAKAILNSLQSQVNTFIGGLK